MSEAKRIADQLQRAYAGEAWHGPSLAEALAGVDAETAARRPANGGHSIWEIVRHVTTWNEVPLRRLEGETPQVGEDRNWPSIDDATPEAWAAALAGLEKAHRDLHQAASSLGDESLERALDARRTVYSTLLGVIQHDVYHAGQIAILKKGAET